MSVQIFNALSHLYRTLQCYGRPAPPDFRVKTAANRAELDFCCLSSPAVILLATIEAFHNCIASRHLYVVRYVLVYKNEEVG